MEKEPVESKTRDDAARFGTLCHYWKETGSIELDGSSDSHRRTLANKLSKSAIRRAVYWDESKGKHEVTFAVNLRTLEVKWYTGSREGADEWKLQYSVHPEWIAGTIDWVEEADGTLKLIGDLKTGSWPVDAADNKQLMSYMLPYWLMMGRPFRFKQRVRIEQWPKYPLHGLPELKYAWVTGLDMECHLQDLQWALDNTDEANPDEETCRFCEGKPNCPAFMMSGIKYRTKSDG